MKKFRLFCLTIVTILLICLGFSCGDGVRYVPGRNARYALTVNDPLGHILTEMQSEYEAGEELVIRVYDAYSGVRVVLYLDDRALTDFEYADTPFVYEYHFTMPNHDATLRVTPPYTPGGGGDSSTPDSSDSSDSWGGNGGNSNISSDSTLPELNSYTFTVNADYHISGSGVTLLFGSAMPYFNAKEYGVAPLIVGEELTVYFYGDMWEDESYPGMVGFQYGESAIHWIEKKCEAVIYELTCQDGSLYDAAGAPVNSDNPYIIQEDSSCIKSYDLSNGTIVYGAYLPMDGAPNKLTAIYAYNPKAQAAEYPLSANEVMPWIKGLDAGLVQTIEYKNSSIVPMSLSTMHSTTSWLDIQAIVGYFKSASYKEVPAQKAAETITTQRYIFSGMSMATKIVSIMDGKYYFDNESGKCYEANKKPPQIAELDYELYSFNNTTPHSSLFVNDQYAQSYGNIVQDLLFKKVVSTYDGGLPYRLETGGYAIYLLDARTFYLPDSGVYQITSITGFERIFEDYDPLEWNKEYKLTLVGSKLSKDCIQPLKDSYKGGEVVSIEREVLMDAVVCCYLNGELVSGDSFVMPTKDSTLFVQVENGFIPPKENVSFVDYSAFPTDESAPRGESIRLISTYWEMIEYLTVYHELLCEVLACDVVEACMKYDEEYFAQNSLIVVCTSGFGEVYNIDIVYDKNYRNVVHVNILRDTDSIEKDKVWEIFVEIPKYNRIERGELKIGSIIAVYD